MLKIKRVPKRTSAREKGQNSLHDSVEEGN